MNLSYVLPAFFGCPLVIAALAWPPPPSAALICTAWAWLRWCGARSLKGYPRPRKTRHLSEATIPSAFSPFNCCCWTVLKP